MRNKYFSIEIIAGKSNPNSIQTKQFQIRDALFVLGDAVWDSLIAHHAASVSAHAAHRHILTSLFSLFGLTADSSDALD